MQNSKRIHLITSEPSLEEVERLTDSMHASRVSQFASELDIARAMWRSHRALVEAPEFPPELVEPLIREGSQEPGEYSITDDFMQPGFREQLHQEVLEHMRAERRNAA